MLIDIEMNSCVVDFLMGEIKDSVNKIIDMINSVTNEFRSYILNKYPEKDFKIFIAYIENRECTFD